MSESVKRTALFFLLILLVILASPLLFPLLVGGVIATWINKKQFKQRYKLFLDAHDNMVFFCYSDRSNKHDLVEQQILPRLDPSINVIFVQESKPDSDFDTRCISYMLDNVSNNGCPNLMRISNGKVIDIALEKPIREAFSGNSDIESFVKTVHEKVNALAEFATD